MRGSITTQLETMNTWLNQHSDMSVRHQRQWSTRFSLVFFASSIACFTSNTGLIKFGVALFIGCVFCALNARNAQPASSNNDMGPHHILFNG
jgi:hypothetical protein